ncbi:hypothetical protein CDD80_6658 [Ophiocordyceps camponoti-rufipedis]|uniref:UV excision repair protein RAD23 n=1 Tax=Ophiocordyceps camponoti-rufipedis TaxID=2004952 RepID=A0A2C5YPU8_9HYPO|nr:hypothetical protein CDD80_6658 [Ophiocordyceps camponoti-rufipedis]
MKITFRDLKQQKFSLDVEPTDLVSTLKEMISADKSWDPKHVKLIYSGKILKDDETVESYNIEEKGFVVCMVNKPKEKPPVAPSNPAAESSAAPSTAPAASSQSASAQATAPATPTPSRPADTPATGAGDSSGLAMGAQRAEAITNMEAMGFERSQIEAAMRAAFNNPDRAVEYILNGIPENIQQEQQQRAAPAAAVPAPASTQAAPEAQGSDDDGGINLFDLAAQQGGGAGASRGGGSASAAAAAAAAAAQGGDLGNLDFLRHNPQFQQLRQVVQQQPQMLEPILQQLGAGNPHLAQLIAAHPDQFLQLLGEDVDDDVPLPPGAQAISVTEEERDAIERLCRLGFDRDQAIQAYFACDKNEELAANFLFDQPEDDEPSAN